MDRRIVLPGGSGYLGRAICADLLKHGDQPIVLTRGPSATRDGTTLVHWDGTADGDWVDHLDGAAAVVHLAGTRVDVRPTKRNIARLIRSRVDTVRAVGAALRRCSVPPPVWVQSATAAIHGDGGDAVIDDEVPISGVGPPQMVQVAMAWERAVAEVTGEVDRTVVLRFGVTVGPGDPASDQLAQLARLGLGGPIAGGAQWFSWLSIEDLVAIVRRALADQPTDGGPPMRGAYLATSPNPVTNVEHLALVRELVGRTFGLPAPRIATIVGALALGADPALALVGRRCLPSRLLAEGFAFADPVLRAPLARALDGGVAL